MEEKTTTGLEVRLTDLWLIFKRCWWLMLIVAAVVFLGTYTFAKVTYEEEYTATAVVWALPSNSANSSGVTSTSDISIGTQLINDFKQLLITDGFLQKVLEAEEMDVHMSTSALKKMISVSHEENTRVMYVSVTVGSAARAEEIVNTTAKLFCDEINERAAGATNPTTGEAQKLIIVWEYAEKPTRPSNSVSVLKNAVIAAACAALIFAIYFVLYILDDKINTPEDVQKHLGVSMLGMIPNRLDVQRRRRGKGAYYGYYGSDSSASSADQGGKK